MPRNFSLYTKVVLNKVKELERMQRRAEKSNTVPFMQERLSLRDEARRVRDMGPQERVAWVQQVGIPHAVEVAKHLSERQANG